MKSKQKQFIKMVIIYGNLSVIIIFILILIEKGIKNVI